MGILPGSLNRESGGPLYSEGWAPPVGIAINLKIPEKGFDFRGEFRLLHYQVPAKVDNPFDMFNRDRAYLDTGVTGCTGPELVLRHHLAHHDRLSKGPALYPPILLDEQIISRGDGL